MKQEFDSYVHQYVDQHRSSIRLSGEEPEYFANYKVRELVRMSKAWDMAKPAILDFGSGIGSSIPAFREHFPHLEITQSDVSLDSLKMARATYGGTEPQLLIKDGRIPVEDGSFDLVFTACVFHHIPHEEHLDCLTELRRVTSPGGRLVIFEHNPWNPLTLHAVANCPFDVNARLLPSPMMRRRMVEAGWCDVAATYHVFFPAALSLLRSAERALGWCPIGAQYSCVGRASS